jgi:colanic acid/amylovoran biosynthesis glycosyltransferase
MAWDFPVVSETFVGELARGLVAEGCDLRILAVDPQARGEGVADGLAGRVAHAARQAPFGMGEAVAFGRARRPGPAALGLLDALALGRSRRLAVARMMAREAPFDIVHCQFAPIGLVALRHRRLGTLAARRIVVHLRGYDISALVREKGEAVYARLFREADLFVANCQHFRARAIGLGCPEAKVVVIGSPIDTERFRLRDRSERAPDAPLALVAVGRLVEKKGFADAIAALAALVERGIDARLRLVGDGPLGPALRAQAEALGVAARVRFDGAQPQAGVIAALEASDIALAPSVRAADGDEDAPVNTLKEAMATGLPVVATRHGGIPELVRDGENGRLVPERDPAALAAAVADLAAAPGHWDALGRAGRAAVVQDFARETVIARTLAAYRSVLDKEDEA